MSNRYFTNVPSFTAGTVARGDEVDDKFDAVTAGLDQVESEVNDAIRLTNADITTEQVITSSATTRANKVIGFDASGNLTLLVGGANWKGDWTTATYYRKNEIVRDAAGAINLNSLFICTQEHTSSNFATDAGNWDIMVDVQEVEFWAHLEGSTVDGVEYSAKENAVGNAVTTGSAKNWATKTTGAVAGGEYSAKEYAIGTTVAVGSAKDWATQLTTSVDGSGYSAKEWAIGATVSSAYRWAELTGASVDGGGVSYSAKEWAQGTFVPAGSAKDWATQTITSVDGSDYSAKEYAVGVDVPAGSAKEWATVTGASVAGGEWSAKEWATGSLPTGGSSKLWATKLAGTVDGVDYSAREYATGTTVPTGSSEQWATKTGAVVASAEYSSKEWAVGTTVPSGSAKDWAMQTGGYVTGTDVSAKEWAIGTFIAAGSAKDWATQAEDSLVDGAGYSALHWAAKAAASATAAATSYDSFDDRYLGPKASDPTLDNDGAALLAGALYWNTAIPEMRVYTGSAWVAAYADAGTYLRKDGSAAWTGASQKYDATTFSILAATDDSQRAIYAGGSAASSANGAYISAEGLNYGGAGAGGALNLVAAAGKAISLYAANVLLNGTQFPFPSGTKMVFYQAAAPTGWTRDTTAALNDSMMRIVTGGTPGTTGGTTGLSTFWAATTTGSHTLTSADIPGHTHSFSATSGTQSANHTHTATTGTVSADHTHGGTSGGVSAWHVHGIAGTARVASGTGGWVINAWDGISRWTIDNPNANHTHWTTTGGISANHTHGLTTGGNSVNHTHSVSGTTGSTGSGGGHSHSLSQALKYADVLIATKD